MSGLPKVLITDYVTEPICERVVLDGVADTVCLGVHDTPSLCGRIADATAIICYHEVELTAALLDEAAACVGVVRGGVGFNNVDIRAAGTRGIVVCNVPDYGTEEVADHALMLLLAVARRLAPAVDSIRRGEWNVGVNVGSPRLRGQTVGVIGAGRIGTAFARRAQVLGMRVVIYDPYVSRGFEKAFGVERAWSLEELLPQCSFVSIHCPLTDETRGMLSAEKIALLPRGAYVVNTSRGGVIDEEALVRALDSGDLAAAALDVLEREPLNKDKFRYHPRLLITPHCAFYSMAAETEMRTKAAEEALRIIRGETPRNPVNLAYLAPGATRLRGGPVNS